MTSEMELVVDAGGDVRCVYGEELHLRELGKLQFTRASHVEPDAEGYWWADMGPVDGPVLGPYGSRSEALEGGCRLRGYRREHDAGSRNATGQSTLRCPTQRELSVQSPHRFRPCSL